MGFKDRWLHHGDCLDLSMLGATRDWTSTLGPTLGGSFVKWWNGEIWSMGIWLVVYLPLWKIWKSVGMIISQYMEKCSKPPTRYLNYNWEELQYVYINAILWSHIHIRIHLLNTKNHEHQNKRNCLHSNLRSQTHPCWSRVSGSLFHPSEMVRFPLNFTLW